VNFTCLLFAVVLQVFTSGAQPVVKISEEDYDSLFLKSDGSLRGMGDEFSGELGEGT
jgi:hypothetical protein